MKQPITKLTDLITSELASINNQFSRKINITMEYKVISVAENNIYINIFSAKAKFKLFHCAVLSTKYTSSEDNLLEAKNAIVADIIMLIKGVYDCTEKCVAYTSELNLNLNTTDYYE